MLISSGVCSAAQKPFFRLLCEWRKKLLIKELIEKIDLYPRKNRSGQWIKTIYFKFPMYYNDSSEADCAVSFDADGDFLPKGKTDETVCLLSRNK